MTPRKRWVFIPVLIAPGAVRRATLAGNRFAVSTAIVPCGLIFGQLRSGCDCLWGAAIILTEPVPRAGAMALAAMVAGIHPMHHILFAGLRPDPLPSRPFSRSVTPC